MKMKYTEILKEKAMAEKEAVWVKGYLEENGDIIISLGDDGYHRILQDYVKEGVVELKKENE